MPEKVEITDARFVWPGALRHWRNNDGDTSVICELLRRGVPPPCEVLSQLADAVEGKRPRTRRGGPAAQVCAETRARNEGIRAWFSVRLGEHPAGRGMREDVIDDAATYFSLSHSTIRKIVRGCKSAT